MAKAPATYDAQLEKTTVQLVGFLRRSRGSSTVADMVAGTGLPKQQVEQAARRVLDEYAGRLKVTESGELLYSFPSGMHSTVRGAGPVARRVLRAAGLAALRALRFLFKAWIVGMLVGYFVIFLAIAVVAVVATFAASMARQSDRDGGRDRGGGFGGAYIFLRLLDLVLRMWFWSSILGGPQRARERKPGGRAFYKSVFGFVFGDGDPNAEWDEAERRHVLAWIVSHKGVITLEELMAMTGRDPEEANALLNRFLREFEGEPGVTEDGTVVYSFPSLMRTARQEPRAEVPLRMPGSRQPIPFSANARKTNGWIVFFNAFNLAFGSWFLGVTLSQGAAAFAQTGPSLTYYLGQLLQGAGISPVPFTAIVLGAVPVAFSVLFFLVPLLRTRWLARKNAMLREAELRRRVMETVLANPARVEESQVPSAGPGLDPRDLPRARRRLLEKVAAALGADPLPAGDGTFAWRFKELERQAADLAAFRRGIDLRKYELGRTVFDTGT